MATAQEDPRWPSSAFRPPLTTTVPHNLLQKAQWPLQIIDLLLGSTGMYILVTCRKILSIFLGRSYRPELHYMRGAGPKWFERHGRSSL